ncbi:MAG: hypothetical protein AVDCRST_MAG37-2297 [uncultured Rubrobacteraceae bacterium]|uniref:Uncharacterized protein n=1 Tax=uncultured Rubrobacteraceae bacterium TaxID=349277 RepID=A0A6J4QVF9_9ACTN|nr:MAG: hypothetical protein AVDCRST_MAG37-2297 [uncultured Rubrobacteraceae bacterium]
MVLFAFIGGCFSYLAHAVICVRLIDAEEVLELQSMPASFSVEATYSLSLHSRAWCTSPWRPKRQDGLDARGKVAVEGEVEYGGADDAGGAPYTAPERQFVETFQP